MRIREALSSCVPRNADLVNEAGDLVRVFRKTGKHYLRLYPVIRVDVTHVFIIDNDREVKFSKHQVVLTTNYGNITTCENLVTNLHSSLPKLSPNRPCKLSTTNRKEMSSAFITAVLHHKDLLIRSEEADLGRKWEIENLARRTTWELVLEEDVASGSKITEETGKNLKSSLLNTTISDSLVSTLTDPKTAFAFINDYINRLKWLPSETKFVLLRQDRA